MSHSPATIRAALADAIKASATAERPWHEVNLPADLYESQAPELSEQQANYGFAVGRPESAPQQANRGCLVVSSVFEVVWSRIIGADPARQVFDYDRGLADEQALLAVVLDLSTGGRNPIPDGIATKVLEGQQSGLLVGRIRIRVIHQYPLS